MSCPKPSADELRAAAAYLHVISDEEVADRVRACHKVARWLISQATTQDPRFSSSRKAKETQS